jgi:hypothetical protein
LKLWFLDGKDADGRIVSNPQVGYGLLKKTLAGGKTKEMAQIGFSANSAGISVYILGIEDKKLLAREFGKKIGKAKVTGYCISFKSLASIDVDVLAQAMRRGTAESGRERVRRLS